MAITFDPKLWIGKTFLIHAQFLIYVMEIICERTSLIEKMYVELEMVRGEKIRNFTPLVFYYKNWQLTMFSSRFMHYGNLMLEYGWFCCPISLNKFMFN